MSGSGTLEVDGNGQTLELNAGTFTGTLSFDDQLVGGNTVEDNANVIRGDVDFKSSGDTLRILSDAELDGAIRGPGTLELNPLMLGPTGVVTLRGVNSHTNTHLVSGTLRGDTRSLVGDILTDSSTAIEIDQADSGVLNAEIASGGTLSGFGDATGAALVVSGTVVPTVIGDNLRVASATFQQGSFFRARVKDDDTGTALETAGDIDFSGFHETAEADFDTLGFGAGAELGINAARLGPVVLQPVAAIDWTQLDQEAFRESGAGALNLDVESETTSSVQTSVGLSLNGRYAIDERSDFVPELRARWLHEFGDLDRRVRSRFEGPPTEGLVRVSGAETPRDALLAGVGWTTTMGSVRSAADYDALVDGGRLDHLLSIRARFAF